MTEGPQQPPQFPPTIQQGAAFPRTVRPDEAFPPTVQQGAAFPPTVQQGAGGNGSGGAGGAASGYGDAPGSFPPTVQQGYAAGGPAGGTPDGLPQAVAERYEPGDVLGSGSEGTVWLARRRSDGRQFAVKLYRPAPAGDFEAYLTILERLRSREYRYVPKIEEYGSTQEAGGTRLWVVMEYLPLGTLTALMAKDRRRTGGLPEPRARQILLCVAEAINYWLTTIGLNLLDLKPANFMIRRTDPLELVVVDLGGAVRMTLSQQYGAAVTTLAYMPPEGLAEWRSEHWPWWALGEIAYELITGRARFDLRDISSPVANRLTMQDRAFGRPDLAAVPDDRWRLLIAGLLTRVPEQRWGYDQVKRWANGENPPVYEATAAGRTGPAKPPIVFGHRNYDAAAELAAAMADQPAAAAQWLQGPGREALIRWLDAEPKDTEFSRDHLYGLTGPDGERRAHRAVTVFAATYLPDRVPTYRGHPVTAEGLLTLARQGSSGDRLLSEMLSEGIVQIAAQCACDHQDCGRHCAVLEQVATEVPRIAEDVERRVQETGDQVTTAGYGGTWRRIEPAEQDMIRSRAVALTIAPASKRGLLEPTHSVTARNLDWWSQASKAAQRADARTIPGRVAVITALVMATRAASVGSARETREQQARQVREAPRRRADRTLITWAVILIVTVGAPIGLGILWHKHLMSLNTSPPPDPRAIPGGKNVATYGPEFVFGAAVVAGLLGLALLRPPWTRGRVPRIVAGALLLGLGLSSPWLADAAANGLNKAGMHTYTTGPVPFSVLGSTCGEAWTSSVPDNNGAFTRWALTDPDGSGTCATIVAYRGWQPIWSNAARGQQAYATLASYGSHVLVAVRQGGTGALVAMDDRHGNILWRWRCPGGGSISGWTFRGINNHTQYSHDNPSISVACQDQAGNDQTYRVVPHRKLS